MIPVTDDDDDDDVGWFGSERSFPEPSPEPGTKEYEDWQERKRAMKSQKKIREDPWIQEFKKETDNQEQEREKRFLQECDANNTRRRECGMAPYSYETFKKYGTGIF